MSALTIYAQAAADAGETVRDFSEIQSRLAAIGVQFERWNANQPLAADAEAEAVLAAYREEIDKLSQSHGFKSVDVISLTPEHPNKDGLRQKFLSEHTHADFEVRFFVAGQGLFYLHPDENVYAVLCRAGDLISVPANTPHWFDMGEQPDFKCIRLFTTPEGWVADFTGSDIASRFPDLDVYATAL